MPFIVLEGLDGAGKSTQLNRTVALFAGSGAGYEYLHFPRFDSPFYGELIARFLRGEFGDADTVDPYIVALLFAGDRADAGPMIREWLDEGKWVITDRYVYSNIAFQCAKYDDRQKQDALRDWILDFEFGYNKLPRPDVSLFLDVPLDFVRERLASQREGDDRSYLNGAKDIHEQSLELQSKVRDMYLRCAAADNSLNVIDCSDENGRMDAPDNIFARIESHIKPLIIR